ncbi:hypothetical protein NMG60_11033477 [Bertholletia excelsa]
MPTFPEEAYPFLHKDEIMIDYLDKKATGQKLPSGLPIGELDVHPSKPWVLFEGHPQQKELCFFSRLEMIKETGTRARRAVGEDSVWTNQGKQEIPKGSKKPIGWKIHLTHHEGGKPTGYWMHEYRLAGDYEKVCAHVYSHPTQACNTNPQKTLQNIIGFFLVEGSFLW